MSELNILFQGDMVRAILNQKPGVWPAEPIDPGKPMKWQTRRIIKPQPSIAGMQMATVISTTGDRRIVGKHHWVLMIKNGYSSDACDDPYFSCPYGRPGDRLWVRETWKPGAWRDDGRIAIDYKASPELTNTPWVTIPYNYGGKTFDDLWPEWTDELLAAGSTPDDEGNHHWEPGKSPLKWRPSIFMPRWASRIDLKNRRVRGQRIQDISEEDAIAEGVSCDMRLTWQSGDDTPLGLFGELWDSINGRPKPSKRNPYTNEPEECYTSYPWDDYRGTEQHRGKTHYVVGNPWVWVVDFMRLP